LRERVEPSSLCVENLLSAARSISDIVNGGGLELDESVRCVLNSMTIELIEVYVKLREKDGDKDART